MRMALPPPHTHTHNSKLQDPKCASGEQSPGKSKAREPQPRPQEKSCLPWSRAGPGESEGPMSLAPYCYLLLESHLDSIAVSLFGNMTVETGEIHIITKE